MRARPLALSLVVHAALLALIGQVRRRAGERAEPVEVELVAQEEAAARPPDVEPEPALAAPEPSPAPPAVRHGGRPRGAPRAAPDPAADVATGAPSPDGLGLGWSLGALGGDGGAAGAGGGRGIRGAAQAVRAPPAPLQVSKARPPRLVYPKRFRDERDGEVFVALLTIDEGGWVIGVRLVQGVSPWADQKALDAVWRFHYDPALDDAGRPVRARVEQRFMVD